HAMFERVGADRIGRPQVCRPERALPIEIGCHLIYVTPNLGLVRRAPRIENPYNRPRAFAKLDAVANVGMGKAFLNGMADYDLTLPGSKPSPLSEFYIGPQLEAVRHHASHCDVYFAGTVGPRQ